MSKGLSSHAAGASRPIDGDVVVGLTPRWSGRVQDKVPSPNAGVRAAQRVVRWLPECIARPAPCERCIATTTTFPQLPEALVVGWEARLGLSRTSASRECAYVATDLDPRNRLP